MRRRILPAEHPGIRSREIGLRRALMGMKRYAEQRPGCLRPGSRVPIGWKLPQGKRSRVSRHW